MPAKRKYDSEDDFEASEDDAYHGPPQKRTRRQDLKTVPRHTRNSRQEILEAPEPPHSTTQTRAKHSKRTHKPARRSQAERLAAELASLADFNAPPKPRRAQQVSDDEDEPVQSRRTRDRGPVKDARISKPKPAARAPVLSSRKRAVQEKLLAEVVSLEPWHHWESEEEDSSSDDDEQEHRLPRIHSRTYPPNQLGIQNTPWSSLPAEMRNTIYEYCMAVEEQKVLTVVHYPEGIPRRSVRGISTTTNFAHSFWGFTQTCKQVRDELTPWLLSKRSVRTPLETLNNYVELFHRPSPVDGKRIGRIEPICTGAPLPDHGVEILKLVKQLHHSPDFHLKLDPPSPYPPIEELQADPDSDLWDEMTIFRNVEHLFASGAQSAIDAAGIQAIHVTSIPRQRNDDEDEDDDEGDSQDTLIKLRIARGGDRDQQLKSIMKFLVLSGLARRTGLKVKARVARGNARWIAKAVNGMVVGWKTRRGRGVEVVRLVTEDGGGVDGFVGIELG